MSKVMQVEIEAEQHKIDRITAAQENSGDACSKGSSFGLFSSEFIRRHGLHLVGTATTWFPLDIAFYSQNLFQKDIFSAIGWIPAAKTMSALQEVFRIARAETLIALFSTVQGMLFTFLVPESKGKSLEEMSGENDEESGGHSGEAVY
ncbi:hypothetical protein SAY86_029087 [Trapa natans]|uniref:Uncharacterized protein n=1 Tax=Trapa natans TaxID=22666 RepID=A0AAN7MKE2_TRANT|nr:hypothetical protein SAY86_029087 [Trapa natans]